MKTKCEPAYWLIPAVPVLMGLFGCSFGECVWIGVLTFVFITGVCR